LWGGAPDCLFVKWTNIYKDLVTSAEPFMNDWLDVLFEVEEACTDDLKLLLVSEWGIGGSNSETHRQIRPATISLTAKEDYYEITLRARSSRDGSDTWSVHDMTIYGKAFVRVLEKYMGVKTGIDMFITVDRE
jgi:hypothetical protein